MRGGPRMMCSPYLTGSLAIMLVLVTFNYWSVSTTNFDLTKEVKLMQAQLKTGSSSIEQRDREAARAREEVKAVRLRLEKVQEELKIMKTVKEELKICDTDKDTMRRDNVEEVEKAKEEAKKVKEKLTAEVESLREEKEALERRVETQEATIEKQGREAHELRAEVARLSVPHDAPPQHLAPAPALGQGQLPDVRPGAVEVVRKETAGGGGLHIAPLAPSPSSPRPQGISSSKSPALVDNVGGVMPPPHKLEEVKTHGGAGAGAGAVAKPLGPNLAKPLNPNLAKPLAKPLGPNLDRAEDDAHLPRLEEGGGRGEGRDDDQNPNGEIDETVDPDKQKFLEVKAEKDEAKDVAVDGEEKEDENDVMEEEEDDLNIGHESLNNLEKEET